MRHALDRIIRRHFFVLHMALIVVAAVLIARIVTNLGSHALVHRLISGENAAAHERPPRFASSNSGRDFGAAANANIFEGRREVVDVDARALGVYRADGLDIDADIDDCRAAPPSELRLRLVGTVVFSERASSLASIIDESAASAESAESVSAGSVGAADVYSINECVSAEADVDDPEGKRGPRRAPCKRINESAVLARIQPDAVCIVNEAANRLESLVIAGPGRRPRAVASVTSKNRDVATDASSGAEIRQLGERQFEVGRREIDRALNDLPDLMKQVRIVPAFEGGQMTGFKLSSMKPGSLFTKIGLQNGDVIKRINGYDMSVSQGLELYTKLKDSERVSLDIMRRGSLQTVDYTITQ